MGIVLHPEATIAGHAAEGLRHALRASGLHLPQGTARPVTRVRELLQAGLIEEAETGHRITAAGRGLLAARFGDRMTLAQADALLDKILDRLTPERAVAHDIREVFLYGSVMRREPRPSDIDMLIASSRTCGQGFTGVEHIDDILGDAADQEARRSILFCREAERWTDMVLVWDRERGRLNEPEHRPHDPQVRAGALVSLPEIKAPAVDEQWQLIEKGADAGIPEP